MDYQKEFLEMKKKEKLYKVLFTISVILLVISVFLCLITSFSLVALLLSICLFSISCALKFGNKSKFKEKIIPLIINDKELEFICSSDAMNAIVCKSEIIRDKISNKIRTNDIITGFYQNIYFRSFDCSVYKHKIINIFNKDHLNKNKIFKGRFYQIRSSLNIKNRVIFYELNSILEKPSYKEMKTNNVEFDSKFLMFNKYEDTSIFTDEFYKAILDIEKNDISEIAISFINNSIYVSINNNIDSFEFEHMESINEVSNTYSRDLEIVYSVYEASKKIINKNIEDNKKGAFN